jgi:hypothetical protein
MRRATAILAATCSMGLGGATTVGVMSASAATTATQAAPAQAASCVYGKIGGARKCLRAGEYCARRYQRQYLHYGFTCSKRDRLGDWHLERT